MTLDDVQIYISVVDGRIHYDRVAEREFRGNFQALLSCVDDCTGDDDVIDWPAVRKDYAASMKMPRNQEAVQ